MTLGKTRTYAYAVNTDHLKPDELLDLFKQLLKRLDLEVTCVATTELDSRNLEYESHRYFLGKKNHPDWYE